MKVATGWLILFFTFFTLHGETMCRTEKEDITLSSVITDAAFTRLDIQTQLRFLILVYEMLEINKEKEQMKKLRVHKIIKNIRF